MATYKLVDTEQLDADLKTVADAIREKGGTTDQLAFPDGMASAVEAIQAGGGDEPTPPDDGKTRIYIHLDESRTSPMLGVCPKGTVVVDWGDGTTPDTLTGTMLSSVVKYTPNHEYAEAGDYVITLTVVDGEASLYGSSTMGYGASILRQTSESDYRNIAYSSAVKRVEVGEKIYLKSSAFAFCYSLKNVVIPDTVTSIGDNTFFNCHSIQNITIPDTVTSIGNDAFKNCYSLESVVIPDGVSSISGYLFSVCSGLKNVVMPKSVTSIGSYAFSNCYSLSSVTIPNSVTSIGGNAFNSCYSMRYYDFSSFISVPTLSNKNAFTGIPADCEILIPAALFDEWSNATNWTTYASYMKAV